MKKFLVLYRMDMGEMQKMMASTSAEDRKKSMGEWEVWMKKNNSSFVDSGAPVGKTKQTTKGGVADIKNDIGVAAASCDSPARWSSRPLCQQPTSHNGWGYRRALVLAIIFCIPPCPFCTTPRMF